MVPHKKLLNGTERKLKRKGRAKIYKSEWVAKQERLKTT